MINPSFRPALYRENIPQQQQRLAKELDHAHFEHTLYVVRLVSKWFEKQRMLGDEYSESNLIVEADIQCKLNGVVPENHWAAVRLITDIYFGR